MISSLRVVRVDSKKLPPTNNSYTYRKLLLVFLDSIANWDIYFSIPVRSSFLNVRPATFLNRTPESIYNKKLKMTNIFYENNDGIPSEDSDQIRNSRVLSEWPDPLIWPISICLALHYGLHPVLTVASRIDWPDPYIDLSFWTLESHLRHPKACFASLACILTVSEYFGNVSYLWQKKLIWIWI